ncbi:MAG: transcriptional regulator, GntR family [Ilumatobacteraceae bacterium]|nr:transcriptional regulator, GntR family [Ilumatobacteraceae bacterium]
MTGPVAAGDVPEARHLRAVGSVDPVERGDRGVSAPNAEVETGTLSDEVYRRLRQAIVKGEHRPNARLIEAELAEQLQVSRTPIRDSLLRLAGEGLVLSRRRGWVVREHTAEEIAEIYGVRLALEGYAARLAATIGDDAALERIRSVHERGTEDQSRGARERLVDDNDDLHDAIVDAAGNARLKASISQTCEYYFNHRVADLYSDDEATQSIASHDVVVRAILARDGDAAEAAMRAHIAEALTVIRTKVR